MINKRNIIAYSAYTILKIAIMLVLFKYLIDMSTLTSLFLNLIVPSIALFIVAGIISFTSSATLKKCIIHALILALLTFAIGLVQANVLATDYDDLLMSQADESVSIVLDEEGLQDAIDAGLVDVGEDGELYIEAGSDTGELYSEWEVEMVEQSTLSIITDALFNFVLAFIGGIAAMKLWSLYANKKHCVT